jgi:tetratricopeptide (TPR) repeat protein
MPRLLHCGALPLLLVSMQSGGGPAVSETASCLERTVEQRAAAIETATGPAEEALALVQRWLRAVDQHDPGAADPALARVHRWSGSLLDALWRLGLEPLLHACDREVEQRLESGDLDPAAASRQRLAVDRILRGGAILHGDAAMVALPDPATGDWTGGPQRGLPPTSRSAASMLSDGTHTLVGDVAGAHWAMARRLLDQIRTDPASREPSPAADPMVRSWYRATLAFMAARLYGDTRHVARAEQLFGDDAVVRLLIGSLHEWMASDAVQQAMVAAKAAGGNVRFAVRSSADELGRARDHLERAVRLDPGLVEARVRLGRVLGRIGRHEDAAVELRRAAASAEEIELRYYAHLFLGAEEEAAGRFAEAREAYRVAAFLYPAAPSPLLASSHLARRQGNREEALQFLRQALAPSSSGAASVDPMRFYHRAAGRNARSLLREMAQRHVGLAPEGDRRPPEPR